jgi:hypothetical protein
VIVDFVHEMMLARHQTQLHPGDVAVRLYAPVSVSIEPLLRTIHVVVDVRQNVVGDAPRPPELGRVIGYEFIL